MNSGLEKSQFLTGTKANYIKVCFSTENIKINCNSHWSFEVLVFGLVTERNGVDSDIDRQDGDDGEEDSPN